MASDVDNARVFTPPPYEAKVDEPHMKKDSYGWHEDVSMKKPPHHSKEPTYASSKRPKATDRSYAGSINSGYVPSDNELVYGITTANSVRSTNSRAKDRSNGGMNTLRK